MKKIYISTTIVAILLTSFTSYSTTMSVEKGAIPNTKNSIDNASILVAPTNDDPSGAIPLTVGPDFATNAVVGTNVDATASEVADVSIPAPGCANYNGGDIWYSVVVPANGNLFIETAMDPGSFLIDTGIAAYSGTIGSLALVSCDDDHGSGAFSRIALTGQTPGASLYIRVWDNNNINFQNFQISAYELIQPANDEAAGAAPLSVGLNFDAQAVTASNYAATESALAVNCFSTGSDIWFSVLIPSTGSLKIETGQIDPFNGADTTLEVYNSGFSFIVCDDNSAVDGLSSLISLTGQTPGALFYIRARSFPTTNQNYKISAYDSAAYTNVPDDNFEQELITLGYDSGPLDNYVFTDNVNTVTSLNLDSKGIADLTGIEAFIALTSLDCNNNSLTSINVTQNTALTTLICGNNALTAIDVTQNTSLDFLVVYNNQITSLDLSSNTDLTQLDMGINQLTSLDLTAQVLLTSLIAHTNPLVSLNIANGNNDNITLLNIASDPDLTCVTVDTQTIANDWNAGSNLPATFLKDSQTSFSTNCGEVILRPFVYLQGALLNSGTRGIPAIMTDDLRSTGLLPTSTPYSDSATVLSSVFNTGGTSGTGDPTEDIVDWVWVELRDDSDNTLVIDAQSALLQRAGRVVDLDGLSDLVFTQPAKHYNVVIKHRNHSGIMTAIKKPFPQNLLVNFGSEATFGTNAQAFISAYGVNAMWAGDGDGDGQVRYLGSNNDSNFIKDQVLAEPGNTTMSNFYPYIAYDNADLDMNGQVRYLGSGNDTNIIKDIILSHPDNVSLSNLFPFSTQVPEN